MALFWRKLKMLIEPSSATVVAAVRNHPELFAGKRVGAILSGGNIHPSGWTELTADLSAD
jgi:threonine dehydratase